jgi:hypothetical protein
MSDSLGLSVMLSSRVQTVPPVSFDRTLGALLIGTLLSMAYVPFLVAPTKAHLHAFSLWGVTCVQTYEYFSDNEDNIIQRLIVSSLLHTPLTLLRFCCRSFCFGVLKSYPFRTFCSRLLLCNRVIDTLSSAMHSHMVYFYLITNYGNPKALRTPTWQVRTRPRPLRDL